MNDVDRKMAELNQDDKNFEEWAKSGFKKCSILQDVNVTYAQGIQNTPQKGICTHTVHLATRHEDLPTFLLINGKEIPIDRVFVGHGKILLVGSYPNVSNMGEMPFKPIIDKSSELEIADGMDDD
jgi:hypothetical protein